MQEDTFLFSVLLQFYFNCLHTKSLFVTQFLKPDTQTPEPNLQNHTLILGLWLWIHYVTHTNLKGINITAKVFANVCFWDMFVIFCQCCSLLWMQCFILQEMWGILHFVCAVLGFVCKVLEKRGKVLKMCKQLKKLMCSFFSVHTFRAIFQHSKCMSPMYELGGRNWQKVNNQK